ncbi:MAG: hypothetical protein QE285_07595 [Aquabacterium sp.]|nr:hypothetical protein [Aquabacterium sp.]
MEFDTSAETGAQPTNRQEYRLTTTTTTSRTHTTTLLPKNGW